MKTQTLVKDILFKPRLILNPLLLLILAAAWIRDVVYWLPGYAFETSLNYRASTD